MILFDGHTHIYDCYDLEIFFAAAFKNFSTAGAKLKSESSVTFFMLLAEAGGVHYFKKLQEIARSGGGSLPTSWRVEESDEAYSLFVFHDNFPSMRLIVAAGRQLITKEKLEILALMTEQEFEDGMTLEDCVDTVAQAGGIPVCPWGAGKWMGTRGKVLADYTLNSNELFYLGDSGGRPSIWPRPSLFKGKAVASRLLSGSDPLPLAAEEGKVGQFGAFIDCDCPQERPATFLRDQLKNSQIELTPYGRQCCPLLFFKNQVALRLKK
ncbi:MAG: hypothetical protein COA36_02790 [Desulfotalea sp.]|nr:MAG: hypothetical protein COA36_02790 [Desulfotalea sp.]